MVRVVVGKPGDEVTFDIDDKYITAKSFLDKSADPINSTDPIKLNWTNHKVFKLYKETLTTGAVPGFEVYMEYWKKTAQGEQKISQKFGIESQDDATCRSEWITLCELYACSEKLSDWKTNNIVMTTLMAKLQLETDSYDNPCLPGPMAVRRMYDGTDKNCLGRTFLHHVWVRYGDERSIDASVDDPFPDLFYKGFFVSALQYRGKARVGPVDEYDDYQESEKSRACNGKELEVRM